MWGNGFSDSFNNMNNAALRSGMGGIPKYGAINTRYGEHKSPFPYRHGDSMHKTYTNVAGRTLAEVKMNNQWQR
jgi:hypothetical protein